MKNLDPKPIKKFKLQNYQKLHLQKYQKFRHETSSLGQDTQSPA